MNSTPAIIRRNEVVLSATNGLALTLPEAPAKVAAWLPKPNATGKAVSIILAASSGLLLTELERDLRRELVLAELHKLAMRLGHKETLIDAQEARTLRDDVTSTVLTLYPRLTVPEFQLVLMLAATGELDENPADFAGVNLRCVSRWFRFYHTQTRPQAMEQATAPALPAVVDERPPFCELPSHHPVNLLRFVAELAGHAELYEAGNSLPPLFFVQPYAYNNLKLLGAVNATTTGYNPAACMELLTKQARHLCDVKPKSSRTAEAWGEFVKSVRVFGVLPDDNYFSDEALTRTRAVLLQAWLRNHPTAQAVFGRLLPLVLARPFIHYPPFTTCPVWTLALNSENF